MLIVFYQTTGTPVYETELGPNIGYNDIREGYTLVKDVDDLCAMYDPETYRKLDVVAELDCTQFEKLIGEYNRWQA